jgi:hypothetical protein
LHPASGYAINTLLKSSQPEEIIMADAKTKPANYTDEMVLKMLDMYEQLGNDGLETIAETLGRPVRSVRSKLVREGVYVATPKAPKAPKAEGPSKKELLNILEGMVPFSVDGLTGATKEALSHLIAFAETHADAEAPAEDAA